MTSVVNASSGYNVPDLFSSTEPVLDSTEYNWNTYNWTGEPDGVYVDGDETYERYPALQPVYAPSDKQTSTLTNPDTSSAYVNGDAITHDGKQKRYYYTYYETQNPGPATLFTGTHTTRTHKHRRITAKKHAFIHTRTVHINADHPEAGDANRYREDGLQQYTDVLGGREPDKEIDLEWDGTNWELSSTDHTNKGDYIIQNGRIYRYAGAATEFTFNDNVKSDNLQGPGTNEPTSDGTTVLDSFDADHHDDTVPNVLTNTQIGANFIPTLQGST